MSGRLSMTTLGAALVIGAASLAAQTPAPAQPKPRPPESYAAFLQTQYANIKKYVVASAEKMPAEHFGFKPTPEVRTYGQLLGHILDTNYFFCNAVKGGVNPADGKDFEKIANKAELVQAVKDSFAYCDDAFATLTDQSAMAMIKVGSGANVREAARGNQLTMVVIHSNEHYGNLVTYLRMKGIVPPSSGGTAP
jgi:uncharacterized damage-inducible protein DinB